MTKTNENKKDAKKTSANPTSSKNDVAYTNKVIITIISLIFFYPIGLILMFVWTKWPAWVKIFITIPLAVSIVMIFSYRTTVQDYLSQIGQFQEEQTLEDNKSNCQLYCDAFGETGGGPDCLALCEQANPFVGYETETLKHVINSQIAMMSLSQIDPNAEVDPEQTQQLVATAVEEAKLATESQPDFADTWINLGRIYMSILGAVDGSYDFAVESYEKAIELAPEVTVYRLELGQIHAMQGEHDKAIAQFTVIIEANPNDVGAYYNLGMVYKESGDAEMARENFNKALELSPDNPEAISVIETQLEDL